MLLDRQIDAVTFTSASTVRNFVQMLGDGTGAPTCCGRRWSPRSARSPPKRRSSSASSPTVMPERYTIPDLVDALVEHFAQPSRFTWRHPDGHATDLPQTLAVPGSTPPQLGSARTVRGGCAASPAIRALVRETRLSPDSSSTRCSSCSGEGQRREVGSMPGVFQLSVDEVVQRGGGGQGRRRSRRPAVRAAGGQGCGRLGRRSIRTRRCSARCARIKREVPDLLVVTDVCLCEYTSHGHCGILVGEEIVNDATVEQLARAALSHAAAGADIVAPSDMMDGRVGRIREALDDAGFTSVGDHVLRGEVLLGVLRPVPRGRRTRRRRSAIAARTRWIRPTSRKRCAKSRSTSRKAPTS